MHRVSCIIYYERVLTLLHRSIQARLTQSLSSGMNPGYPVLDLEGSNGHEPV